MKILFLDLETTFQTDSEGRKNPSPFHPDNYLVSAGWWWNREIEYCFYRHNEVVNHERYDLQKLLDNTDLLVAHNTKFELQWLKACGFKYDGPIHDTMLMAYVLSRGKKWGLSLEALGERYDIEHKKKGNLVDQYLKQGIGFEAMPWEVVQEYGTWDVLALKDLYELLLKELNESPHLWPTVDLTHEFCQCLAEIEENGIKIDVPALYQIERDLVEEITALKKEIEHVLSDVMGDTPINIESPEQLSQVIYSRRVTDKDKWKEAFNLGAEIRGSVSKAKRKTHYSRQDFVRLVKEYTVPIFRTTASRCNTCDGQGRIQKFKQDGNPYKRESSCKDCAGTGVSYNQLTQIAGFKATPLGSEYTSVGGFKTDKGTLRTLADKAPMGSPAQRFLTGCIRVSQLESYLNMFIAGIKRNIGPDDILHPHFMQHITATGRLSSTEPNFQNLPRGDKLPLRMVVISRFKHGHILSSDAKQLEFRIAGELSGSKMIFKDVLNNVDVHSETAKHTGLNRQDAKSHTFAPVYGATATGKMDNIATYYDYFSDRYRLSDWWSRMVSSIIHDSGLYRLPSGREFDYGEVKRYPNGGFSFATQIKNYPVQAFATADIVPIVCICAWNMFKLFSLRSVIILEVHDDITIDVYPGEEQQVVAILQEAWDAIPAELLRRYKYEIKMPIEAEHKIGVNWLEQKEFNHVGP